MKGGGKEENQPKNSAKNKPFFKINKRGTGAGKLLLLALMGHSDCFVCN
jgi:hypothetical protein